MYIPFQSELTSALAESLFKKEEIGLTPFEESSEIHKLLINSLIPHIESVNDELQRVPLKRRKLSLKLLEIKCEIIPDIENMNYTDDMLLNISLKNSWPVLTVDKELKERLIKSGGSYIEVTSSRNLRIIGLRKGE